MRSFLFFKNLHLAISALIIIPVGLIYGFNPSEILPQIFGFEVQALELKNIFRSLMGLYLTLAIFWIIGINYPAYWRIATWTCVLFMGGLAFGRMISTVIDGVSGQYLIGLVLELVLMVWGIINLRKGGNNTYI